MSFIRDLEPTGKSQCREAAGARRASWNGMGVSRTPVRQALPVLAQEGLLIPAARGYSVRGFSGQERFDAVDLRGVLEGTGAPLPSAGLRAA